MTSLLPLVLGFVLCAVSMAGAAEEKEVPGSPRILCAVAANAVPAVERLARAFEQRTSCSVVISSGATGLLMRQALEGAPFDLFISADMAAVRRLAKEGVVTSASVAPYARGRLMLWQRNGSLPRIKGLRDLALPEASRLRVALANPETAPYGEAARIALEEAGITLHSLKGRIVIGEDIRQALQYAETGNADIALVAASLVAQRKEKGIEITLGKRDLLIQGLGLMTRSATKACAEKFRLFLLSREAGEVWREFGYLPPD